MLTCLFVKGIPLVAEVAGDGEPLERPEVHSACANVDPNHGVLESFMDLCTGIDYLVLLERVVGLMQTRNNIDIVPRDKFDRTYSVTYSLDPSLHS